MTESHFSAVRPRVRLQPSGEVVLLEDLATEKLETGETWYLRLSGELGAGTIGALHHLVNQFQSDPCVRLPHAECAVESPDRDPDVVICIHPEQQGKAKFLHCDLAGWGRDEWIEYLLAVHHDRCASVMRRLQADAQCSELEGNPTLWRHVLDELAADEELPDVRAALQQIISRIFPDLDNRRFIGWQAFRALAHDSPLQLQPLRRTPTAASELHHEQRLMKRSVLILLAAEVIVRELLEGDIVGVLSQHWPLGLIKEVARHVATSPTIQEKLRSLLVPDRSSLHPLVASLLHASDIGWKPQTRLMFGLRKGWLNLMQAHLPNADWPKIDLTHCVLEGAGLAHSNLAGAKLGHVTARRAVFDGAKLHKATLSHFNGDCASFVRANLSSAHGLKAVFVGADLSGADLSNAHLVRAYFYYATLRNANFRNACLRETRLNNCDIECADFSGADLESAVLAGLNLTVAYFDQAQFRKADLSGCDLEAMHLFAANFSEAKLTNALLTASKMAHANFSGADLQEAGLADVDWEFANLRNANLTRVSFHMGSTRDGLVGSTIPMHGSRTGFYTDDYSEQDFKAPEEIRKANLRGADLRGACIGGTDFYLVDLRDALYDESQRRHFIHYGAIL